MAAAMASLNMAAAVPVVSCAVSRGSEGSASLSASTNFGGMRLNTLTAAAPRVSRSSRSLVVFAGEKPSFWESITQMFTTTKKKATEAAAEGEKEMKKAAAEAKEASGDVGAKAESLKEEAEAQADEAAKEVQAGVEDLQTKIEEAVEAAQSK